ncbi:hypothetical protein [Neolewinella persica]|uniref:hypothetical protein n=1 Tax=Neolewinella persica TaxID=70998 RepID=UPI0003A174A7|nr:hypothetical protein [Neolewinella persica]
MPTDQQINRPITWRVWAAIVAITLGYTWFYYQKMLSGPLVINDDMVQHYLWLFVDHFELNWKDTFYADASAAIQPRGFYWLLKILGLILDPVTISRAGPFLISLLTVGFGVALLRRYTHVLIALAGCLLAVHLGFHSSVGFVARAFFMPLILAFAYFLIGKEQPWGVAATALFSALFYPPALLLNGGIFGLYKLGQLIIWGRGRRMHSKVKEAEKAISPFKYWYVYLLGFGLALVVVWLHAERVAEHPSLGGYLERVKLISWPEFRSGGRVGIQHAVKGDVPSLLRYLLPANFHSPFGNWFPYLLLALAGGLSILHRRRIGQLGWWLLAFAGVAVAWYFIARQHFPLLFLPDRYLIYPWRLWTPMILTLIAAGIWLFQPKTWLAVLLAAGLLGYGYYRQTPDQLPTTTQEGRDQLFAAINALPEASLIAVTPNLADQVPVFAHRNVFISNESAHALYFKSYHDYLMPRFHDFMTAYTTTGDSLNNVVEFMDKWDIDHLLIDRKQLREGWIRTFEPHLAYFNKRIEGTDPKDRTLLHLPDSMGVLVQNRLHLVSRDDLASLTPTDPVGVNPE